MSSKVQITKTHRTSKLFKRVKAVIQQLQHTNNHALIMAVYGRYVFKMLNLERKWKENMKIWRGCTKGKLYDERHKNIHPKCVQCVQCVENIP